MKKEVKRTVEVNVCDICDNEVKQSEFTECPICKREICNNHYAYGIGNLRRYSDHETLNFRAIVCTDCERKKFNGTLKEFFDEIISGNPVSTTG